MPEIKRDRKKIDKHNADALTYLRVKIELDVISLFR
jgi:hypothetical protein